MHAIAAIDGNRVEYSACCGKTICSGCIHAVEKRDGGVGLCPFCRTPAPTSEELIEQHKKRIEAAGDAEAMYGLGCSYADGSDGLTQDFAKALELWHQAGELGNATSYYNLGVVYDRGEGVGRDEKKAKHFWELAAMEGHEMARYNLGICEGLAGNMDRALKHFMITAGFGDNDSLEKIKQMFMDEAATKDDYAKALQAYQANLVEIKSAQRDEAAAFNDTYKYY